MNKMGREINVEYHAYKCRKQIPALIANLTKFLRRKRDLETYWLRKQEALTLNVSFV